jgi:3-oxoacyl-[acyl-carrier protein] reductase
MVGVMRNINDLKVGDYDFFYHSVERADIENFARISGDNNPLHLDKNFSNDSGHRDVVSHGMLTASLVSQLIGTRLPGHGSFWTKQEFEFTSAVYPGDTLKVSGKIKKVLLKGESVEIEFYIENQDAKVVLRGVGSVRIPEQIKEPQPKESGLKISTLSALVIGASGSLGTQIFQKLVNNGVRTLGTFKSSPDGLEREVRKNLILGLNCNSIKFDSRSSTDLKNIENYLNTEWGLPDIIVNCSAIPPNGVRVADLDYQSIDESIKGEISGLLSVFQFSAKSMIERKFGRVISIGSTASIGRSENGWASYLIGKQVSKQVIKSIASEYGLFGITANMVTPGLSETGMAASFPKQAVLVARASTPSQRLVTHSEVADLIDYLSRPSSGSINGQEIVIDGGRTMN